MYSSSLRVLVSTNSSTNSCRRKATLRFLDDFTTSPVVGSTSPARIRSCVVCGSKTGDRRREDSEIVHLFTDEVKTHRQLFDTAHVTSCAAQIKK